MSTKEDVGLHIGIKASAIKPLYLLMPHVRPAELSAWLPAAWQKGAHPGWQSSLWHRQSWQTMMQAYGLWLLQTMHM